MGPVRPSVQHSVKNDEYITPLKIDTGLSGLKVTMNLPVIFKVTVSNKTEA